MLSEGFQSVFRSHLIIVLVFGGFFMGHFFLSSVSVLDSSDFTSAFVYLNAYLPADSQRHLNSDKKRLRRKAIRYSIQSD